MKEDLDANVQYTADAATAAQYDLPSPFLLADGNVALIDQNRG